MTLPTWPKPPVQIIQRFESRRRLPEAGALTMWAVWAVEGLYYLDHLDENVQTPHPDGYHPEVIDIAHVRWATGTSITSLDLCAAVLGRACCAMTGSHELDLRDFDPNPKSKDKAKSNQKRRSMLTPAALLWVDSVFSDQRYSEIQGARNPLTHSRLNRILSVGPRRTEFVILSTGHTFAARDLVTLAKNVAFDQVSAFLHVVDAL